jgi:hypothetical protein
VTDSWHERADQVLVVDFTLLSRQALGSTNPWIVKDAVIAFIIWYKNGFSWVLPASAN